MRLKNTKLLFGALFTLLSLLFIFRYFVIGQAVYGDGIYYYAYTRSITIDGDLNFENEYEHRYSPEANNTLKEIDPGNAISDTKTGLFSNRYAIGPGLIWIFPFITADILSNLLNFFNSSFPNNGYSDIYQISVGLFNITLAVIGLYILRKTLLLFFEPKICNVVIITTLFGSNLLYYTGIDAVNSHPPSLLFGSLFFYILLNRNFKYKYILLGLIAGALSLIRTQDIVFMFFLPIYLIVNNKSDIIEKFRNLIKAALSFTFIFSLQLMAWKIIYGDFLAFPYTQGGKSFDFLNPEILGVMFNLKTGIFIWTPFYVLSFLGIIISAKVPRYLLLFVVLQLYLISAWNGWHQGESFGIRMLISIMPIFSLGLAGIFSKIKAQMYYPITLTLIAFNFFAIFYFSFIIQNPTYNLGEVTQEKSLERIMKLFN